MAPLNTSCNRMMSDTVHPVHVPIKKLAPVGRKQTRSQQELSTDYMFSREQAQHMTCVPTTAQVYMIQHTIQVCIRPVPLTTTNSTTDNIHEQQHYQH